MFGRNWSTQLEQAEGMTIPEILSKVRRRFVLWRLVGIAVALVGAVLVTAFPSNCQWYVLGMGALIAGLLITVLLKINTQTTLSAVWVVAEIRKQTSRDAQPEN